jgi:hypothetical protein
MLASQLLYDESMMVSMHLLLFAGMHGGQQGGLWIMPP